MDGVLGAWWAIGRRALRRRRKADHGFAAVDALVALTLLSMTIALTLVGAHAARQVASKAAETAHAGRLLQAVLASNGSNLTNAQGQDGALTWRFAEIPLGDQGPAAPIKLCRRRAQAQSTATGRHFALETVAPCPVDRTP